MDEEEITFQQMSNNEGFCSNVKSTNDEVIIITPQITE